jgi:hypothetical protein
VGVTQVSPKCHPSVTPTLCARPQPCPQQVAGAVSHQAIIQGSKGRTPQRPGPFLICHPQRGSSSGGSLGRCLPLQQTKVSQDRLREYGVGLCGGVRVLLCCDRT